MAPYEGAEYWLTGYFGCSYDDGAEYEGDEYDGEEYALCPYSDACGGGQSDPAMILAWMAKQAMINVCKITNTFKLNRRSIVKV